MIDLEQAEREDRAARDEALNTSSSILVQAPAGSGKTELLATRFLKLLAEVDDPDEVLAITFTRYATAEMRHRILTMLEQARRFEESGIVTPGEDQRSLPIASAALANSNKHGWRLLEQPQRLSIQSIDALCLRIAHRAPLGSGPGGALPPTLAGSPLYRLAARRTIDRLGGEDAELNAALRGLLLLRDSNLANCERLLARMLETRDQWTRAFPLSGDINWNLAKAHLEEPFQREIRRVLLKAHVLMSAHPHLTHELLHLADYSCGNLGPEHEWRALAGLTALPSHSLEFLDHWRCVCSFLLTSTNTARKGFNVKNGFPPGGSDQIKRMKDLVGELEEIGLLDLLREIRELPPPHYSAKQWKSLQHIFTALRHAVAELDQVFAEQGEVDIMEVSMAALRGLQHDAAAAPFLQTVRHLLVDEFQDTSRRQHELIAAILRDWAGETGERPAKNPRTFFLVGDPMQSIYMFRQADVELFDLVRKKGFATGTGHLPLKHLRLSMNFRSKAEVVNPLNVMFEVVFPHQAKSGAAPVDFLPGVPGDLKAPPGAYEVHPSFLPSSKKPGDAASSDDAGISPLIEAGRLETEEIMAVLRRQLPRIEEARSRHEEFTVAVLARAKNHLVPTASALRDEGIAFRAVELETLSARQEILDLRALTRALLHPLDRIAWLAVLRAPWCGLELRDLHLLCGTDAPRHNRAAVMTQVEERLPLLEDGPRERAGRVISVLRAALAKRYRQSSFSAWIERTWNSLGGPACVDAAGYENARAYLRMLETVSLDGIAANGEAMEEQLSRLFASPDPAVSDRCGIQLMTMHKAKGLGFNVVVLPSLHRAARSYTPDLIRYLERATPAGTELLVAPIDDAGDEASPLNRWVRHQKEDRETEERKRLLYVACTRAREELHLFATASVANKVIGCADGSLLDTAWPALRKVFEAKYDQIRSAPQAGEILDFPSAPVDDQAGNGLLESVAAAGSHSAIYRLPSGWKPTPTATNVEWAATRTAARAGDEEDEGEEYGGERPQASRSTRILGTIVHALFERAARLFDQGTSEAELRDALPALQKHAATLARDAGLPSQEAGLVSRRAAEALHKALADPYGLWILKSHHRSQTESSWTGFIGGVSRTIRIDRTFYSGTQPFTQGTECLWIVDYKTATHGQSGLVEFLASEKLQYAQQLESYGKMMRLAGGEALPLRLALYYPMLAELVWWPA